MKNICDVFRHGAEIFRRVRRAPLICGALLVLQFALAGCSTTGSLLSREPPPPPPQMMQEVARAEMDQRAGIDEFTDVARHLPVTDRFEYESGDVESGMTFRTWGRDLGRERNGDNGQMGKVIFWCEGSGVKFRLSVKLNGGGEINAEGIEQDGKAYSVNGTIRGVKGRKDIDLTFGAYNKEEPEGYLVFQSIRKPLAVFRQMVFDFCAEMKKNGRGLSFRGFRLFAPGALDVFQSDDVPGFRYHRRYLEERDSHHGGFDPPPHHHREAPVYHRQGTPHPKNW